MYNWIKRSWLDLAFKGAKLILVSYLSYYLLKACADVGMISEIWASNERYYLASYVGIQVAVTFIFYEGFGRIFEWLIYRWIKKNEKEVVADIDRRDEKDVKILMNFIIRVLKFFGVFDDAEIIQFQSIPLNQEEFRHKWKRTVHIMKSLAGIFVLSLTILFVSDDSMLLFVWLTVAFAILALLSFGGLIIYFIFVENIHVVNLTLKSVEVSSRLIRRKNGQKHIK